MRGGPRVREPCKELLKHLEAFVPPEELTAYIVVYPLLPLVRVFVFQFGYRDACQRCFCHIKQKV